MATFTKIPLSGGGNDGLGITVVQTATAGTLIHTCSSASATIDEIWLYCNNTHTSAVQLNIEFGGVNVAKDLIQQSIPSAGSGLVLVCAGLIVQGNATAKIIRAWATTTASKLEIFGFVNRIA